MSNLKNEVDLYFKFDSLEDFYQECGIIDKEAGGDKDRIKTELLEQSDPYFRGLTNEDILKYKYGYTPGIKKLQELEDLFPQLGASAFKRRWNDVDGDDMDMEKLYDGQLFLEERIRDKGNQTGKFIDMYVSVGENAHTTAEEMMYKSLAAVSIVDYLEDLNYKVRIFAMTSGKNTGRHHGTHIRTLSIEVLVKDYTEPINKAVLLNVFSPWFLRYWMFQIKMGKVHGHYGLGQAIPILTGNPNSDDPWDFPDWLGDDEEQTEYPRATIDVSESREFIVIDKGECLSQEAVAKKIQQIQTLFGED